MASKKGGRGGGFAAGWILRLPNLVEWILRLPNLVEWILRLPNLVEWILWVPNLSHHCVQVELSSFWGLLCVGFLVVVDIWWVIFFLFCFEVEDAVVVLQVSGSRDQFSLLKAKSDSRPFQAYC